MSDFNADWLALREPADARTRSARLARAVVDRLVRNRPVEILDLAAGTGSNTRYLAGRVRLAQNWLLVDRDESLLAVARLRLSRHLQGTKVNESPRRKRVTTRAADLSDLEAHGDLFPGSDLVTASALLDLVSETWLRAMLKRCRDAGAAVLFALTYNGRMVCVPQDPDDLTIRELVNQHQRTDKGFGPALGPDAATTAIRLLGEFGYLVLREPSDWALTPADGELQRQLIEGWAAAAVSIAPHESAMIERWREGRLMHVQTGRSHITVGHEDLAGIVRAPLTATLERNHGFERAARPGGSRGTRRTPR